MEVNNSSSMNEELENITTELRSLSSSVAMSSFVNPCEAQPTVCGKPIGVYFSDLADRIEDAWKREAKAIATENAVLPAVCITKPSGNAASMREALEFAGKELRRATEDDRYGDDVVYLVGCMRSVAAVCRASLEKPPRNCDVGTAEEQQNRFRDFCRLHESMGECGIGRHKASCPAFQGGNNPDCSLWWAQMPYEDGAKEGGEE